MCQQNALTGAPDWAVFLQWVHLRHTREPTQRRVAAAFCSAISRSYTICDQDSISR